MDANVKSEQGLAISRRYNLVRYIGNMKSTMKLNGLENVYSQVRSKNPGVFKTDENKWKSLKEVKNEVGRILYADILKAVDIEVSKLGKCLYSLDFIEL